MINPFVEASDLHADIKCIECDDLAIYITRCHDRGSHQYIISCLKHCVTITSHQIFYIKYRNTLNGIV